MTLLPPRLGRYAAVAALLVKYGRAARSNGSSSPTTISTAVGVDDDPAPEELAKDLEKLGPTFIKLGQLLSTRSDLLPQAYVDALARLQDDVEPFAYVEVQRAIEEELQVRLSKAFSAFEEEPLAAASLGQVHRAALRDGRLVVVKVLRPGIEEQVKIDLAALGEVVMFLDRHSQAGRTVNLAAIVDEFRETLIAELDYRREAANLRLMGHQLADFDDIVVPEPVDGYTTGRVLTMTYVPGTKVTALSPLTRLDIDGRSLAQTLISAYLKQIVIDGVFHADPHPGNVLVTANGKLALIDLGMIGRISPTMQERLLKLLLAISEGRGDEAAEATISVGERLDGFDEAAFRRDIRTMVGRYGNQPLAELQVGRVFLELQQLCSRHSLREPAELTMLGKTLLNLDQVARSLHPAMDVNATIRADAGRLMTERLRKSVSAGGVFSAVLEAKEFAERLPGRVNRVLDALAASELKLRVEMIDEGAVIDGLQKVANRIALGLILAALIVGAAMIMRIETSFRLFGYPGLAALLFILAGSGGVWLAIDILSHDRVSKRRP